MLNYTLYDNNFTTDDTNDRVARPVDVQVNTFEDLVEDITGPGSILKPTESRAVIGNYWGKITDYIREGEGYSDDYISIRFSIKGTFRDDDDRFDPARHAVEAGIMLKDPVAGATAEISLRKVDGERLTPEIEHIYDWASETTDEQLTAGDILVITGERLKIYDNLEEEEGVFFISQTDDSEHRATQIRTNEPKTLMLRIPDTLAPGLWRLEVRTTPRNGNRLRTGIFTPVLTVG